MPASQKIISTNYQKISNSTHYTRYLYHLPHRYSHHPTALQT